MRQRKYHHNVYVIELDPAIFNIARFRNANPDRDLLKPAVYVGMTGLTPEERFAKHKAGIRANRYVQRFGLRLLPGSTPTPIRCPTRPRATWRSSSPSPCASRATRSGRRENRENRGQTPVLPGSGLW